MAASNGSIAPISKNLTNAVSPRKVKKEKEKKKQKQHAVSSKYQPPYRTIPSKEGLKPKESHGYKQEINLYS